MPVRPFSPGAFGKYFLAERLAAGGMAEVYRAVLKGAAGFEKTVALKRILPFFGEDQDFVTLFQDEARIASTLTHANIAQVFEFGEVDGSFYLTMELVDGADLAQISDKLRKVEQPMPLPTAAFVIAEAARGLAHAHDKKGSDGRPLGIVHRDVSPHNILVSYAGEVKVTDFGIAKATGKVHKTATGVVMGKLRYMSPEQVAGDELDPRSDVFSLGVVLYEQLTGGPIFPGDQSLRLAELIHTGEIPPPSRRNPAVTPALDEIVLRALARPRERRYARASELARDLTVYVNQSAPGFTREDLGALVQRVAPPRADAAAAEEIPATERHPAQLPEGTRTPVARPVPTGSASPALAAAEPAPPRIETMADPDRVKPAEPPPAEPPPAEPPSARAGVEPGERRPRRGRRRLSTEAWIGLGLVGVIVVSAVLVVTRVTGKGSAAAPIDGGAVAAVDARAIAAIDAGPPGDPFTLQVTATPDVRRRLQAAVDAHPETRRGVPAADYYVYLTAIDAQIATLTLAPDGTAEDPAPLPPVIATAVTEQRLDDAVEATVEYVRATGELPPFVKGALAKLLSARTSVSADETLDGIKRLPRWSAAALAAWLQPGDPGRLAELAYANDVLGRWCEAPAPPRRHFAPMLCERQALIERLRFVAPTDRSAAALERWAVATPMGSEAPLGEGTIAVRDVAYELGGRIDVQTIHVTLEATGAAPPTTAILAGGWIKGPIEPNRVDTNVEDAGVGSGGARRRLTFVAPRRMFAPVLLVGAATMRLPAPPWGD